MDGQSCSSEIDLCGYRMPLDLQRSECRQLFISGERWIDDARDLRQLVSAGMIAFDIGANIGYISLLLARLVGDNGAIYCFEPDAENYAALRRALGRNDLGYCRAINSAVGDMSGQNTFSPGNNGYLSASGATTVSTVTLDHFTEENNLPRVDFVKIDVEGGELAVLRGMKRTLERFRPSLHVEIHPHGFCGSGDPIAVASMLRQYYTNINLRVPRSSLSRTKRWQTKLLGRDGMKVDPEYVYRHPEQRYFALCR